MKKLSVIVAVLTACIGLSSFSNHWGGEGFEIYLNNKLVMQQFGAQMANARSLQLDQHYANEQLTVKYYHCGQSGKNRHISIKDAQNKILKDWSFADGKNSGLNCGVNEILALQNGTTKNSLALYYTSSEIPEGRLLVTIVSANTNQAKP